MILFLLRKAEEADIEVYSEPLWEMSAVVRLPSFLSLPTTVEGGTTSDLKI